MSSAPTAPDPVTGAALRHAIGHFATGVTVVTSVGADGAPVGTTANAVSSLSLDPPLVLVCFARTSKTLEAVVEHGAFAVNVLAAHHADLSTAFAKTGFGGAWEDVDHRPGHTDAPRIAGALAVVDCRVEERVVGGDHEIVIGRVVDLETTQDDHAPLLFFRGAYAGLDAAPAAPAASEPAATGTVVEAAPDEALAECRLPTRHGTFRAIAQASDAAGGLVLALQHGDLAGTPDPVVRIHHHCLLGDVLGGLACSCRAQLDDDLAAITAAGAGVLLYAKPGAGGELGCPQDAVIEPSVADALLAAAGLAAPG